MICPWLLDTALQNYPHNTLFPVITQLVGDYRMRHGESHGSVELSEAFRTEQSVRQTLIKFLLDEMEEHLVDQGREEVKQADLHGLDDDALFQKTDDASHPEFIGHKFEWDVTGVAEEDSG